MNNTLVTIIAIFIAAILMFVFPLMTIADRNDDITQQDVDEFRAFVRQHSKSNGVIPTQEELDERVRSGELVYVHGYVKQDGTVVEGYYRRYPDSK